MPRPKPKFGHGVGRRRRAVAAARLLSPEPAEHVHRQADAGDDGRGARAGARRSPGAREALRARSCARRTWRALVASSLLARLPIGINALAIVLYLREQTGSFAIAGAVVGHAGGRLGRRRAGRRAGSSTGSARAGCCCRSRVVHAVALGAIVGFAELGAPTVVLVAVRLHRRLRDPADLVGAALAVDRRCSSRGCTRPPTRWTRR